MADSTLWWIVTGVLVAAELLTGTFYLLMLAIGSLAGVLAAYAGLSLSAQLVCAAVIGGGAALAAYLVRRPRPGDPPARAEPSVNMDVGETVQVDHWNADGTARVHYRGTQWTVLHKPTEAPRPGPHRVIELVGSRLLVEPV